MVSGNQSSGSCVFCRIASGELPSAVIWQDSRHLAFLDIAPNTEGTAVVITKKHFSSYFAVLPEKELSGLLSACQKVALLLDSAFPDVERTGLVFEGFGVNHIHAKLLPMHGTKQKEWKQIHSSIDVFFDSYPGYLSSHMGKQWERERLEKIAQKIRSAL